MRSLIGLLLVVAGCIQSIRALEPILDRQLSDAAGRGEAEVVAGLLKQGANPNSETFALPPLHRAARGGHIPGAVNLNWVDAIDRERALRFKADDELRNMLERLGVTPDKEVVAYCHTHHRSSHTYAVLKHLGYRRLRGYPGSWSDWGNDPDTPVET